MTKYLVFFLFPAAISLILTPLFKIIARKLNILDFPSDRKIHTKPIPLLGGIPIFIAFNLTIALAFLFNFEFLEKFYSSRWISIFIAQLIILGVGIYDDIKKVQPLIKFVLQISAGFLLILFGFGIYIITNPFTGNTINLGLLSIPITIIWVVGITNALNLVDGLDGLAAGTAFIVCATIFGVSFMHQNIEIALLSSILAGSILGFLRYNFYPAKIFLGDSGSLLLGLLLAFISIEGTYKGPTLAVVLVPILALGFPIIETLLSMIRRLIKSTYFSKHSNGILVFKADKDHIHHRLLKFGYSQRKVVIILYGICVVLCVLAFISVAWKRLNFTLFLVSIVAASLIGIKSLGYREFKIFKNRLFLPLSDFPIIKTRLFQAFLDLLFISFSCYLSFLLVFGEFALQSKTLFIQILPFSLTIKIIIFYFSRLYKGTWKYTSIRDLLKIGKALIFSSAASSLVLILIFGFKTFGGIVFFILDFSILLTLVTGNRISYRIAAHFRRKKPLEGRKIIIYGAGRMGSLLANELHYKENYKYNLVGFIDDDKKKKDKTINNIPILGTTKELNDIINKNKISEIVISTSEIDKEKLDFLRKFCNENGIDLQFSEQVLNKINKSFFPIISKVIKKS